MYHIYIYIFIYTLPASGTVKVDRGSAENRGKQGQIEDLHTNFFYCTISLIHDSTEYVTIANFLGHMSFNICLDFVLII